MGIFLVDKGQVLFMNTNAHVMMPTFHSSEIILEMLTEQESGYSYQFTQGSSFIKSLHWPNTIMRWQQWNVPQRHTTIPDNIKIVLKLYLGKPSGWQKPPLSTDVTYWLTFYDKHKVDMKIFEGILWSTRFWTGERQHNAEWLEGRPYYLMTHYNC